MPKPRTAKREARRAARDLAQRRAIDAIKDLALSPVLAPLPADPDAAAAYRAELARLATQLGLSRMRRRADSSTASHGDLAEDVIGFDPDLR